MSVSQRSASLDGWLRRARERVGPGEAERIAAHALGVSWSGLWGRLHTEIDPAPLDALLDRRCHGEPLAYLLGTAVFCGLELRCGPGALVPRPETETLVDVVLARLGERPVVADIGCGTGAIALAVKHARPDARVLATDTSRPALRYARQNADRLGLDVELLEGDLLDPLPGPVDVIASNPPYVPAGRTDLVAPDVLREPPEAVFAGPTGDEVIARLVADAPGWLRPGGSLVLEVGTPEQAHRTRDRLWGWEVEIHDDHTDRPRVVAARRP